MMIRFAFLPLLLALNFSMCKKQQTVTDKSQPVGTAAPAAAAATAAPVVEATPKVKKPVVDQTAQIAYFLLPSAGRQDPLSRHRDYACCV